uniref:Uncharacterized protein n=1 Tax=Brassica oleracea TaxID=3712 RepID=A0A3P6CTS8_BRAOL|nr:unnamed protein product [Brassica oleracea]
MQLRGRGNIMNVSQPLVVYSFVSHWSPLFLWGVPGPSVGLSSLLRSLDKKVRARGG